MHPETRNSDKELIWAYIANPDTYITRDQFFRSPSFETITRCRRKIQERHPELQAIKKIKEAREAKQESFPRFIYEK